MKRLRVLLVDDSPAFLYAARALLQTLPDAKCIATATSAEAALQKIELLKPDLVLMDITMPGMGGIEATRRICANFNAPIVVLATLHDLTVYRTIAMQNGAYQLISKADFAFEIPQLIAQLRQCRAPSIQPGFQKMTASASAVKSHP